MFSERSFILMNLIGFKRLPLVGNIILSKFITPYMQTVETLNFA